MKEPTQEKSRPKGSGARPSAAWLRRSSVRCTADAEAWMNSASPGASAASVKYSVRCR